MARKRIEYNKGQNWLEYEIGDCLDLIDTISPGIVDFVLTDPPYNLGRNYGSSYDDKRTDYKKWCIGWFSMLKTVTDGPIIFSIGTKNLPMWYSIEPPNWVFCWFKQNNMGSGSKYTNIGVWEPFLIYGNMKKRMGVDGKLVPIVPQAEADGHDCPKQLDIIKFIIEQTTEKGDTGLDPFLGSGTTLAACRKTTRNCIGFEINPDYETIIRRRIKAEVKDIRNFM